MKTENLASCGVGKGYCKSLQAFLGGWMDFGELGQHDRDFITGSMAFG